MGIFDFLRPRPAKAPAAQDRAAARPSSTADALPTPLSDLMARVMEEPSDATWTAFYEAFLRSPLGVMAREEGGRTALGRLAAPDGRVMMAACADRDAFARNFNDRYNRQVLGRELARVALSIPDCPGILINSASSFNSLAIERVQLAALLERYPPE